MTSVTVENDLVFATAGGTELGLDLYRAPQPGAPVVMYVHGGGWRHGDKADGSAERLAPMAAYGVTVASVNYRLVPGAVFPDQLHDLKGAVRWLRAHGADLGLATARIGVWGASAGAYLGSLLALTPGDADFEGTVGGNLDQSSAVQAAVHWFGQSDLLVSGSRSELEARILPFAFEADLLGVPDVADVADRARELSLPSRVRPQAPPFLIAHGDRDRVIPPSEGEALHRALSRAGANTRFDLLGGAGHEGAEFDRPDSLAMTAAWLRAVLC
ncbi:alpha/beta hydrolase [Planotetraspora phitsanulokensis]|uniref:alpha/beta hydrolase n=1 Tax=Planotetraspora phitsanulokensis TaxID=575192 RepID=UPI00194FF2E3|nr:alpha/beta hydrolase [Planotetraspora phitsanulokensis]